MKATPDVEAMLEHEAQMMARPVEYRNMTDTVFLRDGVEQHVTILVYDAPWTDEETQRLLGTETRFAVWVNGVMRTGGVV